jgi:hypothetical protein
MDSGRSLNGTHNYTLKLEAMRATTGPSAKLRGLRVGALLRTRSLANSNARLDEPYAGNRRTSGVSEETFDRGVMRMTA